jgi:hypothetical protein
MKRACGFDKECWTYVALVGEVLRFLMPGMERMEMVQAILFTILFPENHGWNMRPG